MVPGGVERFEVDHRHPGIAEAEDVSDDPGVPDSEPGVDSGTGVGLEGVVHQHPVLVGSAHVDAAAEGAGPAVVEHVAGADVSVHGVVGGNRIDRPAVGVVLAGGGGDPAVVDQVFMGPAAVKLGVAFVEVASGDHIAAAVPVEERRVAHPVGLDAVDQTIPGAIPADVGEAAGFGPPGRGEAAVYEFAVFDPVAVDAGGSGAVNPEVRGAAVEGAGEGDAAHFQFDLNLSDLGEGQPFDPAVPEHRRRGHIGGRGERMALSKRLLQFHVFPFDRRDPDSGAEASPPGAFRPWDQLPLRGDRAEEEQNVAGSDSFGVVKFENAVAASGGGGQHPLFFLGRVLSRERDYTGGVSVGVFVAVEQKWRRRRHDPSPLVFDFRGDCLPACAAERFKVGGDPEDHH